MKYLPLLWAGLWRKPTRTVLTVLSIAVAFLLFGLLQGVISGFEAARAKLSDTHLRVTNRVNLFEPIPIAYKSQIAAIPGVEAISYFVIFVGYFQDPKNGFNIAAVDVDTWLAAIPNFHVPQDQREAMHTTRTGALVGSELMKKSLELTRKAGHTTVFLVGNPAYYHRFGFKASATFGIKNTLGIPDENVMGLELVPNALSKVKGNITLD